MIDHPEVISGRGRRARAHAGTAFKRLVLLALSAASLVAAGMCAAQPITVSAASSLRNVLATVNAAYERRNQERVSAVYGPSFRLANDIARGAVPDVFISADPASVAYLEQNKLVRGDVLMEVARNRLVIVAREGYVPRTDSRRAPASVLLDVGSIALPNAKQHPAGKFSQTALLKLGLWGEVGPKLRETNNTRAALEMVESREAEAAIVYRSEALRDPKVRILQTLPEASHPPIRYIVAVTNGGRGWPVVSAYVSFIRSQAALDIFERFGFDRDDAWSKDPRGARHARDAQHLGDIRPGGRG